jgi:hypothetical protein
MRNLCSSQSALFQDAKVAKHPFYSIGHNIMFQSILEHFANIRHVKYAKLVYEPECTILGYQSCEAAILV